MPPKKVPHQYYEEDWPTEGLTLEIADRMAIRRGYRSATDPKLPVKYDPQIGGFVKKYAAEVDELVEDLGIARHGAQLRAKKDITGEVGKSEVLREARIAREQAGKEKFIDEFQNVEDYRNPPLR